MIRKPLLYLLEFFKENNSTRLSLSREASTSKKIVILDLVSQENNSPKIIFI